MNYLRSSVVFGGVVMMLGLTAGASAEEAEAALRPKWTAGQRSVYEVWSDRTRTEALVFNGRRRLVTMKIRSSGRISWRVDEVREDGSSRCTFTIDSLRIERETEGQDPVVADSEQAGGGAGAGVLGDLVTAVAGVGVTVEVTPLGVVRSVTGVDAIRQRANNPEIVPSERDFRRMASELALLPAAPVSMAVGASWTKEDTWDGETIFPQLKSEVTSKLTTKLEAIGVMEGVPVATLSTTADLGLTLDPSELPPDAPPVTGRFNEPTVESDVFFDLDRREVVARNETTRVTITASFALPQGRGQVLRVIRNEEQSQVLRVVAE